MNYVNYILRGHPFQPETFISDNEYLRFVTTITVIPVAIIGMPVMGCLLVAAYGIDGGRFLKLRYYQYCKALRLERYCKSVMISLGHNKKEWIALKAV